MKFLNIILAVATALFVFSACREDVPVVAPATASTPVVENVNVNAPDAVTPTAAPVCFTETDAL